MRVVFAGDLKIENVLLAVGGCGERITKLVDFGGATRADGRARRGADVFAAPEVFQSRAGALAIPADMWCLGMIM